MRGPIGACDDPPTRACQAHVILDRRSVSILLLALALPAHAAAPPWPSQEIRDGQNGRVKGVAFSNDGLFMASADTAGTVMVYMFPGPRRFAKLDGEHFSQVAFSPDGETLVAGGTDQLVYIWRRPFGGPSA